MPELTRVISKAWFPLWGVVFLVLESIVVCYEYIRSKFRSIIVILPK